jgi:Tol biopolymer transport system component
MGGTGGGEGGSAMGGMGGMGTGGTGGGSAGQAVLVYGDHATDNTHQIDRLSFPGAMKTKLALMGLAAADIQSVAVSPDGTKLAVAGVDMPMGNPVLNVYAIDGSGAPKNLVTMPTKDQAFNFIAWSPDGKWIAFTGELELNNQTALYVVPSDGAMKAKRVSQTSADTKLNVSRFAWARKADASHAYLAFAGDVLIDNVTGLWVYDVITNNLAAIAPTNLLADMKEVSPSFLEFDSADKIYFKSNHEVVAFRLYRASTSGADLEQVPGSKKTNGAGEASVGSFALSPDGKKLAFAADAPTQNLYQLYVGDVGQDNAAPVSNVQMTAPASGTRGPSFFSEVAWSPDQKLVAVAADWAVGANDVDNAFGLFVLPASGAAGGVRIINATASNQSVGSLAFSKDSARLYATGDLVIDNGNELYSTSDFTTADQKPASITAQSVPSKDQDVSGFVVLP